MKLESESYILIGGSGGIGCALAWRLSQAGARLLLCGRDESKLRAAGVDVGMPWTVCDATIPEQVDAAVDRAVSEFGSITGAVNLAGSLLLKPAHLTTDAESHDTVARSLHSSFYLVRAAAKQMIAKGGSIVLIATAAARAGLPNHEAIAAAKGGVIGLTLSAAATYASRGIRVNCVAPGLVETPLTERIVSREASRQASCAMHPIGRLGRPEEVASAIHWLLDPEQAWVTGQILGVDGGLGSLRSMPRG